MRLKHVATEAIRTLLHDEIDAVNGGIGLGGHTMPVTGPVYCPPVPPPKTHIDISDLAGLSLAS